VTEAEGTAPRRRRRRRGRGRLWPGFLALLVLVVVDGVLLAGFLGRHGDDDNDDRPAARGAIAAAPTAVPGPEGTPLLVLDDKARAQNGITVITLKPAPQPEEIAAFGNVLDPAPLSALQREAARARAARDAAAARLAASGADFKRNTALYKDHQNVSAATREASEAAFHADQAALATAEADLRAASENAVQSFGAVLGPELINGGALTTRLIASDEFLVSVTLPPDTDDTHARALADHPPAQAFFVVSAASGVPSAPLRLISPAPRVDPKSQGKTLFYVAPAGSGVVPGMTLAVFLPGRLRPAGVVVPENAVVWWQGRAWVYLEISPDHFARHPIPTDQPAPGGGFILEWPLPLPQFANATELRLIGPGASAVFSEEFRSHIQLGDEGGDP